MQRFTPPISQAQMSQIVLPTHTNNHGTVLGGQIAAWCDICASISARRFSKKPVVTASMDQLHFLQPVQQGMIVVFRSQVNATWRTSMEVGVRVDAEDPESGKSVHCCTAYLTFVALTAEGNPTPIPQLETGEDVEWVRRATQANERREVRLQMRSHRRGRS